MNKLVLVAMSGGVDSSVALSKVLDMGYDAIGVTMKLYDNKDPKTNVIRPSMCNSAEAINGAKLICDRFGVKHYTIDFMNLFKKHVIDDFVNQYLNGKTPNPCVKCNSLIKWEALINFADEIGVDYIATGHYARICEKNKTYSIQKAIDEFKDQSYMLWNIEKKYLSKTIFPIGDMKKEEVRDYALKHNLETAKREESQDLCFVLGDDYNQFLHEIIPDKMASISNGPIVDEKNNKLCPKDTLIRLGETGVTSLIIEGGASTIKSFFDTQHKNERLVDNIKYTDYSISEMKDDCLDYFCVATKE